MKSGDLSVKIALALSAASGMIYEVVASQILFFYFVKNSYSISLVLSIFLAGLGVGSYIMYKCSDKIKKKFHLFGALQILIGLYGLLVLTNLPSISSNLSTFGLILTSFLILFPPTLFLGAIFPLAGSILGRKKLNITGLIYSIDLAGAIIGTLLAGFLLIPFFGNKITILFAVAINFLAGFFVLVGMFRIMSLLLAAVAIYFTLPTGFMVADPNPDRVFYKPSPYGEVSVEDRYLLVDERTQCTYKDRIHENTWDVQTAITSFDLFENPDILHIGLGCGITVERLLEKTKKPIDIVEINPVIVEATLQFKDSLPDKNANIIIKEGLQYLRNTEKAYDVIILGVENPGVIYGSDLYTKEAFEIAKSKLKEDGIFSLLVPSCDSSDYYDIVYYTLKSVFNHVYIVPQERDFIASDKEFDLQKMLPTGEERINTINKKELSTIYLNECKYW